MNSDKPACRLLTGPDTPAFCQCVADALAEGYVLYGSPSCSVNSETGRVIVAQAVIRPEHRPK